MICHIGDVAYLKSVRGIRVSSGGGACAGGRTRAARIAGAGARCAARAAGGAGELTRHFDLVSYLAAQIVCVPGQVVDGARAVVREGVVPSHSTQTPTHRAARLIARRGACGW